MKSTIYQLLAIALMLSLSASQLNAATPETSALQQEAKGRVKLFATTLKSKLQAAIKEGGFENGVKICSENAPQIAKELSTGGWTIGRVSLKARNLDNQPDEWEKKILLSFAEQQANGVNAKKLLQDSIQVVDNADTYRLLKAIPTGGLCLSCHGKSIEPELKKLIDAHYPQDKATGYDLGEVRGAFSLSKKIAD